MSVIKQRYKRPIITFGLGKITAEISVNTELKCYVVNVYNKEKYVINLQTNATVTKINENEFILKTAVSGNINIQALAYYNGDLISKSKTITFVNKFTADTTLITADSNIMTADNG